MTLTLTIQVPGLKQAIEIPMRPLTVLTGTDEQGLSFIARLVFALYQTHKDAQFIDPGPIMPPKIKTEPHPELVTQIIIAGVKELYGNLLGPYWDKYRPGYPHSDKGVDLTIQNGPAFAKIHLSKNGEITVFETQYPFPDDIIAWIPATIPKTPKQKYALVPLIVHAAEQWTQSICENIFPEPYFIPASRAGIMQVIDHLDSENEEFPVLLAEFLKMVDDCSNEKNSKHQLWRENEDALIGGTIIFNEIDEDYYEVLHKSGNQKTHLALMPCSVAALAPIFLFLKHRARSVDLLIIEEPEAHLDLRQQTLMAQMLVKMVRNNLQVLITTKSETFLHALNAQIVGETGSPDRERTLLPGEVSICRIEQNTDGLVA